MRNKRADDMVFVEGGTFKMGSEEGERDEKPVHSVKLSSFYIGKYPVTQKEWKKIMENNPSRLKGEDGPVENICWYDAVKFCNKLSELEGLEKCYSGKGKNIKCDISKNGYRLPTEAEWEYAAKGGNKSKDYKYSGSNKINEVAWYGYKTSNKRTHPVGQKKPNELGIYDMSGNVWEWCSDWYGSNYYSSSPSNNPTGPNSGSGRVLRGGYWSNWAYYCRVAIRDYNYPYSSYSDQGFRILRANLD